MNLVYNLKKILFYLVIIRKVWDPAVYQGLNHGDILSCARGREYWKFKSNTNQLESED